MQFDRRQIRQPDQRRQIVGQNVMDGAMVSLAPDRSSLHPVRPMLRRILLVEKFFVHAVGIALAGERASGQMRQHRRRNTHVVVDHLLLGKSRRRIQNLFQIRQLELLALNLNASNPLRDAPAGIVPQTALGAKYGLPLHCRWNERTPPV